MYETIIISAIGAMVAGVAGYYAYKTYSLHWEAVAPYMISAFPKEIG